MHLVYYHPDSATICHYCGEGGPHSQWLGHTGSRGVIHPMHESCWKRILAESSHCHYCDVLIDIRSLKLRKVLDRTIIGSIAGSSMGTLVMLFCSTLNIAKYGDSVEHLLSDLSRGPSVHMNFVKSTITVAMLMHTLSIGVEFGRAVITVRDQDHLHMQAHWFRAFMMSYFATCASLFGLFSTTWLEAALLGSSPMILANYFLYDRKYETALSLFAFSTIVLTNIVTMYYMVPRKLDEAIWGFAIMNAALLAVTLFPTYRKNNLMSTIDVLKVADRFA